MSIAGVRSNRGDSFQTLVAMRYAIEMLYKQDTIEIEVDSTSLDSSGHPILIDDIVVRGQCGTNLYIQAKKNQPNFKAWSVSDLRNDLSKAWSQWRREPTCRIKFISRSDFGDLAKLKEHASTQPGALSFQRSLSDDLQRVCEQITATDEVGTTSYQDLFGLIGCMSFEVLDPQALSSTLKGILQAHVAHAELAFRIISQRIDCLARRDGEGRFDAIAHSLTRSDLFHHLKNAGIEFSRPTDEKSLRDGFTQLSQIGRSWKRTVGDVEITQQAVADILDCIASKTAEVLLSAGPGVGKTCVLLRVQEELEQSSEVFPIFVQAREFVSAKSTEERASLGFPPTFVGDVARLSESTRVVVLVDSIDVLSISRDHDGMTFFLSLIDRLRMIPNVTVVGACRTFDVKYDARLADRSWGETVEIDSLNWSGTVEPLVQRWGVLRSIPPDLQGLLCNPRLLAIFYEIVQRGGVPAAATAQDLTECYLNRVVVESAGLGDAAMSAIRRIAAWMLDNRRLDIPPSLANLPQGMARSLLSSGVLIETHTRGYAFSHQTLLDVLAVAHAKLHGETLASFVRKRAAAPFVRPAVRAFLFYLRLYDSTGFRKEVREVLDADDIAFHLRRLTAESLAELDPTAEDWPLVRHMFKNHQALFNFAYLRATKVTWAEFLHEHWLPYLIQEENGPWLLRHLERVAPLGSGNMPDFLDLWQKAFGWKWVDKTRLRWISSSLLDQYSSWDDTRLNGIFTALLDHTPDEHGALGRPLSRWVDATNSHDDILWRYITNSVSDESVLHYKLDNTLRCAPHAFYSKTFLADRMRASEELLEAAVSSIEAWTLRRMRQYETTADWIEGFLNDSSHGRTHSGRDLHHVDSLYVLLNAVEAAISAHAASDSSWWQRASLRLQRNPDGALRYFAIRAMTKSPETCSSSVTETLLDPLRLGSHTFLWEIGQLIRHVYPFLKQDDQDQLQTLILRIDDDDLDENGHLQTWAVLARRDLLVQIPRHHRSAESLVIIDKAEKIGGPWRDQPDVRSWGGWIRPPVDRETLSTLSGEGLLRLVRHYPPGSTHDRFSRIDSENLVGGFDQLASEIREAAIREPEKFLEWLREHWSQLDDEYRDSVVSGSASHLRSRFGNLHVNAEPTTQPDGVSLARSLLDQLEAHYDFWSKRREFAEALLGCADVLDSIEDEERIAFLLAGCLGSGDPSDDRCTDEERDGMFIAINSTRGVATEAAFRLATRLVEAGRPLSPLLVGALHRCANDKHPSVRALALRLLPTLLHFRPDLGWPLFRGAIEGEGRTAWKESYDCLYYNYHQSFDTVRQFLDKFRAAGDDDALKVWGRISALCCLSDKLDFAKFRQQLQDAHSHPAWSGAVAIFAANIAEEKCSSMCNSGMIAAFTFSPEPAKIASKFERAFQARKGIGARISHETLTAYIDVVSQLDEASQHNAYGIGDWLASFCNNDPDFALGAAEIVLDQRAVMRLDLWDGEPYTKLLTALFREAEERELSDAGSFLARVVKIQDLLLSHGVHKVDVWLRDAERP